MVSQLSVEERFWSKVDKTSGIGDNPHCWRWTGTTQLGYGVFSIKSKNVKAYRYSYELLVEPIPAGLHTDHLCRNPGCVNPAHLEPVTPIENSKRGLKGVLWMKRTECVNGHAYTPENTVRKVSAKGHVRRECIICTKSYQKKYRGKPESKARDARVHREKRAAARARK